MAILKFDKKAAYDAATKSTTESTVALIKDGDGIIRNDVNVIVDIPEIGDILFIDANKKRHYIKHDTYSSASFPSGCTIVGVVFDVNGNDVKVMNKTPTTQRWSDVFQWTVTGWLLDSSDHSCAVTLYKNTSFGTFTYNASSLSDCASQLNTWLSTNASNYTCYVDGDGNVILQWNNYVDYPYTHSIAGLSLNPNVGREVPFSAEVTRRCKIRSYYGGCNWLRFLEYYSASGSTPTGNVVQTTDAIVNRNAFNTSDYCSALRSIYSTYEDYLYSRMVINPYPRGIFDGSTGMSNTLALCEKTYTASDGNKKYKYPAARFCSQIGYDSDGLTQGNWYLPSVSELLRLYEQLTYGLSGITIDKADVINRSLNAIGGTVQNVASYRWSCSRCSGFYAWDCGYAGSVSGSDFCGLFFAVPVLALKIKS